MSIQDDIDKLGASGGAKGQCAKCGDENLYSSIACSGCGARLPWADAVSDKARANASTHAPLSIANARATVNQPPGNSGPGGGSGSARGPVAPALATVLLIAGALVGAAVVVPNFTSRSETVQPTSAAGLQAPRSAQAAPSSLPASQAPAPAPQDAAAGMGGTLVRDDVEIKVNGMREAAMLTTSGPAHLEEAVAPAPGKTFLIVNVTVNFKGSGSLQAAGPMLRLSASNKQFYMGGLHKWLDNPTNYTLLMADLAPGGSATGDVVYEVEPGLKVEKLEFIDARPQSYQR